jgi:hypothetical protein
MQAPIDSQQTSVAEPVAADAAHAIPRRTTPTWDIELLISGASVFALFQLSGQIDQWVAWFEPRLGVRWSAFLGMMSVYGKGAVVALAVTFALHLVLRARWIALVGMNSVFPGGIRWDRIKSGPIQIEVARDHIGRMDAVIERADNVSTIVFSIGVALAIGMVPPAVTVVLLYGIAVALGGFGQHDLLFYYIFMALTVLFLLPYLLAAWIDKSRGPRMDRDSRLGRLVTRTLTVYSRFGFGRSGNVLVTVLGSNVGEKKTMVLVYGAMLVVFAVATIGPLMRAADSSLAEWRWMPDDRAGDDRAVLSSHYADLRKDGRELTMPYLPSMVVRGPWLRLVVPYDPLRHNEAIGTACADLPADEAELTETEFSRRGRLLSCIGDMHRVKLDGEELPPLEFLLHEDADGLRGFVAMIDVRALPPGRHVLEIARPTVRRDARRDEPPQPYRIPFWR